MRRSAFLLVVVVFLTAAVFTASASASTTYHGKFTSATGVLADGSHTIGAKGTWNVIVDAQATQITGLALVYHLHTDLVPLTENSPRGLHTGTWLVTWTNVAWSSDGVLTAHGTLTLEAYLPDKSVGLTFTLDPTADIPVTLLVDLSTNYVSPVGWLYWDITGDLRP